MCSEFSIYKILANPYTWRLCTCILTGLMLRTEITGPGLIIIIIIIKPSEILHSLNSLFGVLQCSEKPNWRGVLWTWQTTVSVVTVSYRGPISLYFLTLSSGIVSKTHIKINTPHCQKLAREWLQPQIADLWKARIWWQVLPPLATWTRWCCSVIFTAIILLLPEELLSQTAASCITSTVE